jgi:hypothetical protein
LPGWFGPPQAGQVTVPGNPPPAGGVIPPGAPPGASRVPQLRQKIDPEGLSRPQFWQRDIGRFAPLARQAGENRATSLCKRAGHLLIPRRSDAT